MSLSTQFKIMISRIFAVVISILLVPGGILFAETNTEQHVMPEMEMHCDSGMCMNVDFSCMNHCMETAPESEPIHVSLATPLGTMVTPEIMVVLEPTISSEVTEPALSYCHSNRSQLLSVMKLE